MADAYNLNAMTSRGHVEAVNAEQKRLAEAVRAACLKAARENYEAAAISGLCHEGAMEAALDAISRLDIETLVRITPSTALGKKT